FPIKLSKQPPKSGQDFHVAIRALHLRHAYTGCFRWYPHTILLRRARYEHTPVHCRNVPGDAEDRGQSSLVTSEKPKRYYQRSSAA
ncbi:unnamed protein product, partial [Pylaiella littoralis]